MWIEKTYPPEPIAEYVRGLASLAAEELGIPIPEVIFFRDWMYSGEPWRELDVRDGEHVGGFAQRAHNQIALRADRNLDTLLHVVLHETKHLAQNGAPSAENERDACDWADAFQHRRFAEIMALLQRTGADNGEHMSRRDHDCHVCAIAAETR